MPRMALTAEQRARAKALVGKTIARVELNPFDAERDERDSPATDPVIVFTDGTCLRFQVEETDAADYGVALIYPAQEVL